MFISGIYSEKINLHPEFRKFSIKRDLIMEAQIRLETQLDLQFQETSLTSGLKELIEIPM